jgi:hypothetical protein
MKRAAAPLLALLATGAAPDRPLTTPTRDVDVIYSMVGPTGKLEQRLRWGIAQGKLRVDPPSPGLYVIIDTAHHSVQAVREGDRSVVQFDAGPNAVPGVAPDGAFVRQSEAQVAGLGCTQWATHDTGGRAVLACLTADGVLLRVEEGGHVVLQATEVRFAPLPEAVFRVPADYRKIIPPPVSQKP